MRDRKWYSKRYNCPVMTIRQVDQVKFLKYSVDAVSEYVISFGVTYYFLGSRETMAKRSFDSIEFVSCTLSSQQKKAFAKWRETAEDDLYTYLEQVLLSGVRLSISYSHKDQTCIVSLTDRDEASVNHEKCVSSRHQDPLTAVLVALYKHFEVLKDSDWSEYVKEDSWG